MENFPLCIVSMGWWNVGGGGSSGKLTVKKTLLVFIRTCAKYECQNRPCFVDNKSHKKSIRDSYAGFSVSEHFNLPRHS